MLIRSQMQKTKEPAVLYLLFSQNHTGSGNLHRMIMPTLHSICRNQFGGYDRCIPPNAVDNIIAAKLNWINSPSAGSGRPLYVRSQTDCPYLCVPNFSCHGHSGNLR